MDGRTCTLEQLARATAIDEPADIAYLVAELDVVARTETDLDAIPAWMADEVQNILQPRNERRVPEWYGQAGTDID